MSDDPFNPSNNETTAQETSAPAEEVKNSFSVGFTLKAGTGYEAEWVTPKVFGASAEETAQKAADLLNAMKDKGVFDLAAEAARHTRENYKGKPSYQSNSNGGQQQRQYKKQDNSGGGKTCEHGEMNYREGNKNGKQWKAYFCPADECKPTWVS